MTDRLKPFTASKALLWGTALVSLVWVADVNAKSPTDADKANDSLVATMENTFAGNYLAGRAAQREGAFNRASDFLGAALSQQPATPGLLRMAFFSALLDGRMDQAIRLASRFLDEDPQQSLPRLLLAADHLVAKRYDKARTTLDELPSDGISIYAKPLFLMWTNIGDGQGQKALTALKPLKSRSGTESLVEVHSALALDVLGKTDEAETFFKDAIDRQETPTSRLAQLYGNMLERTGNTKAALALYQLYEKENPGSSLMEVPLARLQRGDKPKPLVHDAAAGAAEALFFLTSSLGNGNAHQTSLALGRIALHMKPNYPIMKFLIADGLENQDRLGQAVEVYDAIDPASPYGWPSKLQAASLVGELGRVEEAADRLADMAKARPDEPEVHVALGDLMRRNERYDEAGRAYDEALKLTGSPEPHHWSLYYKRGMVLERAKEWPRAEKDLLQALELSPDQPFVLNYLGYSWVDQGMNLERATDMIRQAVDLAPNSGYIVDSLGWAYYKQGQYENAVRELERAVELRPQDAIINDHLGDAYWKVGRKFEARFQWRRALSLEIETDLIPTIEAKIENGLGG